MATMVISDNASFITTSTSSFSTAQQAKQHPPRQLRRVKTMRQLTRWVSQKIARPSLNGSTCGNELSEKNLNLVTAGDEESSGQDPSSPEKPSLVPDQTKAIETIKEDLEEAEPEPEPERELEKVKEIRLRRSYAAFCEEFTLSGPQQPKRRFDISMDISEGPEAEEQLDAVQSAYCPRDTGESRERPLSISMQSESQQVRPQSQTRDPARVHIMSRRSPKASDRTFAGNTCSSTPGHDVQVEKNNADMESINSQIPSTTHPRPPPQVLTPSVYKEMQRARQERKRARGQKFWEPLRSLFSRSQPLRGHRVELE